MSRPLSSNPRHRNSAQMLQWKPVTKLLPFSPSCPPSYFRLSLFLSLFLCLHQAAVKQLTKRFTSSPDNLLSSVLSCSFAELQICSWFLAQGRLSRPALQTEKKQPTMRMESWLTCQLRTVLAENSPFLPKNGSPGSLQGMALFGMNPFERLESQQNDRERILPFPGKKKIKTKLLVLLFSDVAVKLQRIQHLSQATSTLSGCLAVSRRFSWKEIFLTFCLHPLSSLWKTASVLLGKSFP